MWERLRRFRALPKPARKIFLRAAVLLPWAALRLKVSGFRATKNALLSSATDQTLRDNPKEINERSAMAARMVRAAARYGIGNPSCLEESLVLLRILAGEGIAAQLRIGIKRSAPKFEAHAWVECGGVALNESESLHDHYEPFEAEFSNLPTERS